MEKAIDVYLNHKERINTGLLLLLSVGIIGYIDNFIVMWLTFGAVYILAFKEAVKLFGLQQEALLPYALWIWLLAAIYPYPDDLFVLSGVAYASAIAFNKKLQWKEFLPFIYPTAGVLFIFTTYLEYGTTALIWLVIVVALTDVGAYVVGKSIGKTKFCETSPNKTMEGVIGGIAVATLLGMFAGTVLVEDLSTAFLISFAVSTSSIFGDLFESSLKRAAGVKDSGNILPGHGGILDRTDGYLFGGIVMLLLLRGLL